MKEEDAIMSLKEVYLFNNLDRDERNNFLYSTPDAITIIQSGGKIDNEKDCRPAQTSIMNSFKWIIYSSFWRIFRYGK